MEIAEKRQVHDKPAASRLTEMIIGKASTQLLFVAARLGIADHLITGSRSLDELADMTAAHAPSLYRVLRALASIGIFEEIKPGHFALTELAQPLRSDASDSIRDLALMFGSDWHNRAWSQLLESVRTGETGFEHAFGQEFFEHLKENPDRFAVFNKAMTSLSRQDADVILEAYDFSHIETIADVGGGHGFLLARLLQPYPAMKGLLLELPEVAAGARRTLEEAGVKDRCRIVEGSFLDAVPDGADAYLLKLIIHDWPDDDAVRILENCRLAMHSDGVLLIGNAVIPPGNERYPGKIIDVEMLVMAGGRERTEEEFRGLLDTAGFELTRTIPTRSYLYLLEARPK